MNKFQRVGPQQHNQLIINIIRANSLSLKLNPVIGGLSSCAYRESFHNVLIKKGQPETAKEAISSSLKKVCLFRRSLVATKGG